jgi:RimJ/RimL family protein N-acetyltransferase
MQGQSVMLRSLLKEDSSSYFRWINNRELVLKNSSYRPISEMEHEQWFSTVTLNPNNLTFSIVDKQHNKLIGTCSLRNINSSHQNAELQIRIGELDSQNKGMGSEAVSLLVKHGFNNLNLQRIYLYVFCTNQKAIRAYEKCSFDIEGTLRNAAYINGEFVDMYLMSVLAPKPNNL